MSEQFEARLIECLDALDALSAGGPGAGIDDILARYPEDAAALRQVLGIAAALPALDTQPDPARQAASRHEFLAAASGMKKARKRQPAGAGFFLVRVGAFLAVALAAGAIPVAASGNALPGDALYPVKREVETVQLQMAPNAASRDKLAAQINARRVQEVDDLVKGGRSAETDFEGRLDSASAAALTVSGRAIAIPAGVHLPSLALGVLVEVTVRVENGQLMLVDIVPIAISQTPTESPAPSAMPSPMPAVTDTPAPEATKAANPDDKHTDEPPGDGGTHEPSGNSTEGGGSTDGGTEVGGTDGGGGDNATAEPTSGSDGSGGGGSDGGGDKGGGSGGGGDNGGGDKGGGGKGGGDH